MFCGAINKCLTYVSIIVSILIAVEIANIFIKKKSVDICEGIIVLLMFQNLALGLGAHLGQNEDSSIKLITQIPFLTISVIFIFSLIYDIKNKLYDKTLKYFFILLLCIICSMALGRGNIQSVLVNMRNLTVFYMIFLIGKLGIKNQSDLNTFVIFIMRISIIFLVAGLVLLYMGYDAYKVIGIKEVYIAKGVTTIQDGLDGRFHTTLISKQYDRMGSLLYEPVNLAYFYAACLLLCIFTDWTKDTFKKILCFFINFLGLVLTFGKGGYMIFGIGICAYLYRNVVIYVSHKISEKTIYKFTLIGIIVVVIVFCAFYVRNIGAAVMPHIWGIQRTWKSVLRRPYGYGLGTGGNAAQVFNNYSKTEWLESGGETALMSFMYQIGIQGIIAFIAVLVSMTNFTSYKSFKIKADRLTVVFNYIPIILLGVSLLQDNTFTPQCIAIYMLILGALKNINIRKASDRL
jgi:hypothetical protein